MILLLITMISCVCAGTLVVNVTQTDYQAKENDSVTLEWTFTPRSGRSPNLVLITCDQSTNKKGPTVLHLDDGFEVQELQDEQFSGRIKWDRDVLREGRLRLHVSRLRTEDSGWYKCKVQTRSGLSSDQCWLNVTATVDQEQHTTPTVKPEPKGQKRFFISLVPVITTAGIILVTVLGWAAVLLEMQKYKVVITVLVVITVIVLIVIYSITVATAVAVAVVGLLSGVLCLAVFHKVLSAPCKSTTSFSESEINSISTNDPMLLSDLSSY